MAHYLYCRLLLERLEAFSLFVQQQQLDSMSSLFACMNLYAVKYVYAP